MLSRSTSALAIAQYYLLGYRPRHGNAGLRGAGCLLRFHRPINGNHGTAYCLCAGDAGVGLDFGKRLGRESHGGIRVDRPV
jgi:hypothetical protein